MNWRDWEMIWKRPELPLGAAADLASIRDTFEVKRRKFRNALLVRDVVEGGAGLLVVIALAFIWWRQGRSGWPIAAAIALVLGVVAVFVRERLRARRNRVDASAPLAHRLAGYIVDLQQQRRLMQRMWQWYFAPLGAAIFVVVLAIVRTRPAWDIGRDPRFLGGYFVFVGLLMVGVWLVNRDAVRRRIEPRLVELEKLRADLNSS